MFIHLQNGLSETGAILLGELMKKHLDFRDCPIVLHAFRQTKMNEWIKLARNNAHNSYVYPRLNHLFWILLDPWT